MSELKHLKMWHGILKKKKKKKISRDEPKPNNWISPLHFRSGLIHFACVYDIIISGTKLCFEHRRPIHLPSVWRQTEDRWDSQSQYNYVKEKTKGLKCLVSDIGPLPGSGIRVWIKYSSHTECGPEVHEKMKIKIKRRRSRKVDQPNFNQVRFITFIGPFPELFDYTCSSITWPKCTQEDRKWNCCDKHHSSVQLHRASQHHYLFFSYPV